MQNRLKETKSQERLINLMLQAGLEWPEGEQYAVQGMKTGMILFSVVKPQWEKGKGWRVNTFSTTVNVNSDVIRNAHQNIITREQFEARDGWVTWHGGECPVDGDVVVDVTYGDGEVESGFNADRYRWHGVSSDLDIIAYRIHNERPAAHYEPCESVKACIPEQPTIEQLIQQWKQKDCALETEERKLKEQQAALDDAKRDADEAKKAVDDALLAAGYFIGGSVVEAEQPTITDWRDLRVGDVVWWSGDSNFSDGEYVVDELDFDDESMPFYLADGDWVRHEKENWKFIRRP